MQLLYELSTSSILSSNDFKSTYTDIYTCSESIHQFQNPLTVLITLSHKLILLILKLVKQIFELCTIIVVLNTLVKYTLILTTSVLISPCNHTTRCSMHLSHLSLVILKRVRNSSCSYSFLILLLIHVAFIFIGYLSILFIASISIHTDTHIIIIHTYIIVTIISHTHIIIHNTFANTCALVNRHTFVLILLNDILFNLTLLLLFLLSIYRRL